VLVYRSPFSVKWDAVATAAPTSEHDDARVRRELNVMVLASVQPIALATAVLFVCLAIAHHVMLEGINHHRLVGITLGSAGILLGSVALLRRAKLSHRAGHPLLFSIGLLIAANSLASAFLLNEPGHTAYLMLLMAAAGFVLHSEYWASAFLVVCWIGWVATMAFMPISLDWGPHGITMYLGQLFTATVLAVTVRHVRARSMRRLISLRLRDQRQRDELERSSEELRRSNEELDRFARVAAHDLKAPLQTIGGYAELLGLRLGDRLDDKEREFISSISVSIGRMNQLLEDILLYATSASAAYELEPTELEGVLEDVKQTLDRHIRESGARLEYDALPAVMAEPRRMAQLFQNLVGNAIKYRSDASPVVEIKADRLDDEWWQVSVRDNGTGFAPEQASAIFEAFTRVSTDESRQGTGIGLAICQRIVERLGGRIWAESEPGEGSVFHFTVRVATPAAVGEAE